MNTWYRKNGPLATVTKKVSTYSCWKLFQMLNDQMSTGKFLIMLE